MRPSRLLMMLAVLVTAILPAIARAEPDPDAVGKLQNFVQSVKDAQSVSYRVKYRTEGGMFAMASPTISMEVLLTRDPSGSGKWLAKYSGSGEVATQPPVDIMVVFRSERYEFAFAKQKQVVSRPLRSAKDRQVDFATLGSLRAIVEADPLSKELAAQTITLEETQEINGVVCDVVLIDPGATQAKTRWFLSQTDSAPQRVETVFAGSQPDGKDVAGKQIHEVSDFKFNPGLGAELFTIPIPEGYTDMRAPAVVPGTGPQPRDGSGSTGTTMRDGMAVTPMPGNNAAAVRTMGTGVGQIAPDFELATPTGEKVKLSSLRGNVVVVDFCASWLKSSQLSGAEVQALSQHFKDQKVKVLGVACKEKTVESVAEFWKRENRTYPLLVKGDDLAKQYQVRAFPTLFVIGFEGEVLKEASGFDAKTKEPFPAVTKLIEDYLKDPKAPSPSGATPASTIPAARPAPQDGDGQPDQNAPDGGAPQRKQPGDGHDGGGP